MLCESLVIHARLPVVVMGVVCVGLCYLCKVLKPCNVISGTPTRSRLRKLRVAGVYLAS